MARHSNVFEALGEIMRNRANGMPPPPVRADHQQQLIELIPRFAEFRPMATLVGSGLPNGQRSAGEMALAQGNRLAAAVAKLTEHLSEGHPYRGQAGDAGGYSNEEGLTSVRLNGLLWKGGIGIVSDIGVISDTAPAGTTIDVPWVGANLKRLTGTRLCRINFTVTSATPSGGILEDQAALAQVTLNINGFPVPEFSKVPLSDVINTLDGEKRSAAIQLPLPYDVDLSFNLTTIAPMGGGVGESSNFFATVDSGSQCTF